MKNLDKNVMKHLSFPDFNVERVELDDDQKTLRIFVEGAWLEMDEGLRLGKGTLFFKEWESLSINEFEPATEKWVSLGKASVEPLRDLCEVRFFNSSVSLCGFGKQSGHWLEWKIVNTKMHAEFD